MKGGMGKCKEGRGSVRRNGQCREGWGNVGRDWEV